MSMKMWVRAQMAVYDLGIALIPMGRDDVTGKVTYVKDITYGEAESGTSMPQSPVGITLDNAASKRLMDDLWLAGIRPSDDISGSNDKTDIKNHLEDMRSIVFNGIKINMSTSGEKP